MFFYPKMVQKIHIWEIYGSLVMAKNATSESDCRILWSSLSLEGIILEADNY